MEMYKLREEIFEAINGKKDNRHYRTLSELEELVKQVGGENIVSETIDVDIPHFLAALPREYLEKIPDKTQKNRLEEKWDFAYHKIQKYGEEHPSVGIVQATT